MADAGSRLRIFAWAALAVGIAMRIVNAFQYNTLWGFDALYNWRYIKLLMKSWALPAPDAAWATAHPPFFYYCGALICRLIDQPDRSVNVIVLRLAITAVGLLCVWWAHRLVRRLDPPNPERALLAGGLVLFLPVHIYMSAMVTEEVLVTALISYVLYRLGIELSLAPEERSPLAGAVAVGVAAGLAFLTKLTGVLVMVAAAGALLVDGWRRKTLRPALGSAAVVVALTALVGGWYYARNLIQYGYLYPHGLATHEIMFTMPPGERAVGDYLRLPLATFSDPQLLNPDLLRSVWGSTYVTVFFDGHRAFLPTDTPAVTRAGTAILLLALLPTVAFAIGTGRGLRRALRGDRGPDVLFLGMVALTLSGYVLFSWKNPWFAVLKASFLLGLVLPFAYYTSEVLDEWLRRRDWLGRLTLGVLATLLLLIVATFTTTDLFWTTEHMQRPGVDWR